MEVNFPIPPYQYTADNKVLEEETIDKLNTFSQVRLQSGVSGLICIIQGAVHRIRQIIVYQLIVIEFKLQMEHSRIFLFLLNEVRLSRCLYENGFGSSSVTYYSRVGSRTSRLRMSTLSTEQRFYSFSSLNNPYYNCLINPHPDYSSLSILQKCSSFIYYLIQFFLPT